MTNRTRILSDGKGARLLLLLVFLLPLCVTAQTYRYLGVEEGLSSHKIYRIQKDRRGYMWFLTSEGMDRYDGHAVKRYPLTEGMGVLASPETTTLLLDAERTPWLVTAEGEVIRYDERTDAFLPFNSLTALNRSDEEQPVHALISRIDELWLFAQRQVTVISLREGSRCSFSAPWKESVTAAEQLSDSLFAIGTERGVGLWRLTPKGFQPVDEPALQRIESRVDELFFHLPTQRLVMANFDEGVLLYDCRRHSFLPLQGSLEDTEVHRMTLRDDDLLLIATGGKGVYGLHLRSALLSPYLEADYNSVNGMNANNLRDLYVDEAQRLWMACFDAGVTVQYPAYTSYRWIRHASGNVQSLINDRIHDVFEDSDGDLWFATANGLSLYRTKSGTWQSFFSSFDPQQKGNHIFLTICEVRPGILWAGGLASGIYQLQKSGRGGEKLMPIYCDGMPVNQYIYELYRDQRGVIWSGGDKNLKSINPATNEVRCYEGVSHVVTILEKDSLHLWVGTEQGLYLLQRRTGLLRQIPLGECPVSVTALQPIGKDSLYIATKGAGLLLYDLRLQRILRHYRKENSALLSNQIYAIIPNGHDEFYLGTKCGLSIFSLKNHTFSNWTADRGLLTTCFNTGAATVYQGNQVVFGGTNGAVLFSKEMHLPAVQPTKLLLRNLTVAYEPVAPGDPHSPLTHDLDSISSLQFSYKQRSFSLEMASVDYDYSSNVLYSWRIKELPAPWSPASADGHLFVQNLPAGHYTLEMRALSKEAPYQVLDERTLSLTMKAAPWASPWAYTLYLFLLLAGLYFLQRLVRLRRQKRLADERRNFYIQTAHDIRTPLTLIKSPMEEVLEQETFTKGGRQRVELALRQVDNLLQLVGQLMNFERSDSYGGRLTVAAFSLNRYLHEYEEMFLSLAATQQISFEILPCDTDCNVWFDREKMDSILKNLLSNAFKYTPAGGKVTLRAFAGKREWGISVKDTGTGISPEEQKLLFRTFYRGPNSANGKIPGAGIGLMLVQKYASLQGGKVRIHSRLSEGTEVVLTFPQGKRALWLRHTSLLEPKDEAMVPSSTQEETLSSAVLSSPSNEHLSTAIPSAMEDASELSSEKSVSEACPRILVVEDHEELRRYLTQSLSDLYEVAEAAQGKEALEVVEQFLPDLIVSDVLMPEMSGDRLCAALKRNFNTSHIPVILLTALSDEKYHLQALSTGADDYLTKPFAPAVLKARIANLLANRERLRRKFGAPESIPVQPPADLQQRRDWDFVKEVNRCIEERMQQAEFNVDRLCELHHMSRTAFYSKLKALTGHAPSEHIRLVRLHRASSLLQEGYTVSEVADMCGFCDAKYFREVFKRHFHENPSEHGRREVSTSSLRDDS